MATETAYEGWAILELMGHRRLGGSVREVEMFGTKVCRIDIPSATVTGRTHATQFYGGSSIYCLTPCTEETARAVAKMSQPEPVQRWELPAMPREKPLEETQSTDDAGFKRGDDPAF